MTKPIGYEALCNALLDGGVTSKQIIKHRFLLQAIAAQARTLPTEVQQNGLAFSFRLLSTKGTRGLEFELQTLSTKATMRMIAILSPTQMMIGETERASFSNVSTALLQLYPLEFTRFERLRIWLEQKWIALKVWCGKMRSKYVD